MEQDINTEMRDRLTKVCICKAITQATIKNTIKSGAKTIMEVQKATGAGGGTCGGRRCIGKIQQLLRELKE